MGWGEAGGAAPGALKAARPWASQDKDSDGSAHPAGSPGVFTE